METRRRNGKMTKRMKKKQSYPWRTTKYSILLCYKYVYISNRGSSVHNRVVVASSQPAYMYTCIHVPAALHVVAVIIIIPITPVYRFSVLGSGGIVERDLGGVWTVKRGRRFDVAPVAAQLCYPYVYIYIHVHILILLYTVSHNYSTYFSVCVCV